MAVQPRRRTSEPSAKAQRQVSLDHPLQSWHDAVVRPTKMLPAWSSDERIMRHLRGVMPRTVDAHAQLRFRSSLERPLWHAEDLRRETTYVANFCRPQHGHARIPNDSSSPKSLMQLTGANDGSQSRIQRLLQPMNS
jgi:hypothetical protein